MTRDLSEFFCRLPTPCMAAAVLVVASSAGAQTICVPSLPTKTTDCSRVLDTTKMPNGPHVIGFRVYDAAGNVKEQTMTIIVSNPVPGAPMNPRITAADPLVVLLP